MEPVTLRRLSQRRIFRDEFLGLREDLLADASGTEMRRKVVEYQPASVILPVDNRGAALLIQHYRHPVERWLWEVPGGMIAPGESAEAAAIREAYEETGYRIGGVEWLATYFPEPAFADHRVSVYLGTDLQSDARHEPAESEIAQIRFFTRSEVEQLILVGEIASSWTLVAVLRGLARLR